MSYHGKAELESRVDRVAASLTDGIMPCNAPVPAAVVDRAKRWLTWMVDVALTTPHGWKVPPTIERTCEGELGLLWEHGERVLYVVVGTRVSYFSFVGHPLWGDGEHGDAMDAVIMKELWEQQWTREAVR